MVRVKHRRLDRISHETRHLSVVRLIQTIFTRVVGVYSETN